VAILHPTKTLTALLPRYVTRFACIGPACEHNCCMGWSITLDKKTFNNYRQSSHGELSQTFAKHIKRNRVGNDDKAYGKIELDASSQQCPLMEDKLCKVQKNLNETYLSSTCFNYPRQTRTFAGQVEQGLVLSCPEAARQALLQPDAFEFTESRIAVRPDSMAGIVPKHGMTLESMNEVRIFCLQLMRTEGLELWQRLAILGVFCEALTAALTNAEHNSIPALLNNIAALIEQGQITDALQDLQPDFDAQAIVFAGLLAKKGFGGSTHMQVDVMDDIAYKLGADPATGVASLESLTRSYRRGVERLGTAMLQAPHILEHYVLNEMFLTLFPFDGGSPFECYLQLISRFGLLRLMLAARCNTEEELPSIDVLVQTVHISCRRFRHDAVFSNRVNGALHEGGGANLEKLYSFLRS